jgi:hypothetical protein
MSFLKRSHPTSPHLTLEQIMGCWFSKPIPVIEVTTPVRGPRVSSAQQSCTPLREPMQNGRGHPSRKDRKEAPTLPNTLPTEGSPNLSPLLPHTLQARAPVASSSSGLHLDANAGKYDLFRHTCSLSMTTPRHSIETRRLPDVHHHIPTPLTSTLSRTLPENFKYVPQLYPILHTF